MAELTPAQSKKHALMSKTLWMNVIMAVCAVLASQWPAVSEYVNEKSVAMTFTVVNMILRLISKDQLYFS